MVFLWFKTELFFADIQTPYVFSEPTHKQPLLSGNITPFFIKSVSETAPNTVGNHVEGYITIDPQPEDEWLEIRLTAGIGETNAIDNLMTGTSSIPEPAALGLLGLVSTGIFFKRRFFIA